MAAEQSLESRALAALLDTIERLERFVDRKLGGSMVGYDMNEHRDLRRGLADIRKALSVRAGEVCENHPSRPVAAPSRVLCAECLQIAYAEARESAGGPQEPQLAALEALWNGDIALTAEQRQWMRQALDVQDRADDEARRRAGGWKPGEWAARRLAGGSPLVAAPRAPEPGRGSRPSGEG